jgi:nickel/cobalt transporter (NicO) family protein
MSRELGLLLGTAISLGFIHTLTGPDHYLPFVAMARIGRWSGAKTALITFLCGIGHILSSVALAFVGVALGMAVTRLKGIESARGEIAAWLLIAFGLTYFVWGLHRAIRGKTHHHHHLHEDEDHHAHEHDHTGDHAHVHHAERTERMTPWILFTIFVFGPCEVLIPLLMSTAARHPMHEVLLVTGFFGASTITTMLVAVMASYFGLSRIKLGGMERYSYAAAGLLVLMCGSAIKWLGL